MTTAEHIQALADHALATLTDRDLRRLSKPAARALFALGLALPLPPSTWKIPNRKLKKT